MAQASVIGVAMMETYASTAWVRASMPVAAVSAGGMPTISSGSLMAMFGVQRQSTIAIFTWVSVLVMMQKRVISLAVPAVVLMARKGGIGLVDLVDPFVVADVAAVADDHADPLAAVMGAAAAEGDDAVALVVLVNLDAGMDVRVGRVRLGAVEDDRLERRPLPPGP